MNKSRRKNITANVKPAKVKISTPPLTAHHEALWKNEMAIALLGILLTVFFSAFSAVFAVTGKIYPSVLVGFISAVVTLFLPKITPFRKCMDRFINW